MTDRLVGFGSKRPEALVDTDGGYSIEEVNPAPTKEVRPPVDPLDNLFMSDPEISKRKPEAPDLHPRLLQHFRAKYQERS